MFFAGWGTGWLLFILAAVVFATNRARLAWGWLSAVMVLLANSALMALVMAPTVVEGLAGLGLALGGIVGPILFSLSVVDSARRSTFRRIAAGEENPVPKLSGG